MNFTTDCCCCVIRTTIGWQEFHYVELPLHGSHYLTLAGIRVAAPRAERHRSRKMHTTPTSQRRQSRPSRTNCARCVVNYSPRGTREKHMAESSVDPPTPPCLDLLRNRECDERVAENYCKYYDSIRRIFNLGRKISKIFAGFPICILPKFTRLG